MDKFPNAIRCASSRIRRTVMVTDINRIRLLRHLRFPCQLRRLRRALAVSLLRRLCILLRDFLHISSSGLDALRKWVRGKGGARNSHSSEPSTDA